jgi:hypothetical protein
LLTKAQVANSRLVVIPRCPNRTASLKRSRVYSNEGGSRAQVANLRLVHISRCHIELLLSSEKECHICAPLKGTQRRCKLPICALLEILRYPTDTASLKRERAVVLPASRANLQANYCIGSDGRMTLIIHASVTQRTRYLS